MDWGPVSVLIHSVSRFEELRHMDLLRGGEKAESVLSTREYWSAGGWTVFVSGADELLLSLFIEFVAKNPAWPGETAARVQALIWTRMAENAAFKRKGQRSIRLNRAYRAFYVVSKSAAEFVSVEEVNKHEY